MKASKIDDVGLLLTFDSKWERGRTLEKLGLVDNIPFGPIEDSTNTAISLDVKPHWVWAVPTARGEWVLLERLASMSRGEILEKLTMVDLNNANRISKTDQR